MSQEQNGTAPPHKHCPNDAFTLPPVPLLSGTLEVKPGKRKEKLKQRHLEGEGGRKEVTAEPWGSLRPHFSNFLNSDSQADAGSTKQPRLRRHVCEPASHLVKHDPFRVGGTLMLSVPCFRLRPPRRCHGGAPWVSGSPSCSHVGRTGWGGAAGGQVHTQPFRVGAQPNSLPVFSPGPQPLRGALSHPWPASWVVLSLAVKYQSQGS